MPKKDRRHELGVGILVLGAAALLGWMALQVGAMGGLGRTVRVHVRLEDAGGLAEGGVVKVAGVDVGRIASMKIEDGLAVLDLEVSEEAGLRRDALALIRARSVLGEKFVELRPRSKDAPLLVGGEELEHGPTPIEIDELVNDLGPLVASVRPELLDETLGVIQESLARDPERVERMLSNLDLTLQNAAAASAELPALVTETRSTLATVRATAQEARPVIARADAIATEVEAATRDLGRTRAEVDLLLQDSRAVVQDGGRLVERLEANGDSLERILGNLEELDKWELRRLLREEGIVVRLRAQEVEVPAEEAER